MSEFLKRLRGQAELECLGEFTLDVEQAHSKMAHFQFPHPHDFLYHLAAGLFRLGASRLHVFYERGRLVLEVPALRLPANLLEDLPVALFDERSASRRLAAAAQSLLVFELVRFDWIGTQQNQVYDYLTGRGQNWQSAALFQVQIEGVPAQVVEPALGELARRAAWSRRPLQVGERRFQRPQGLESKLGGYPAECEWSPGEKPQLLLIMDELATGIREVEAPFAWRGICYGEYMLDASLAQVVEDDKFLGILQDIPATFLDCVRLGLRSVPASEILGLLAANPLPPWLQPLQEQLFALQLFQDQHGRAWSLGELLDGTEALYYTEGGGGELQQLDCSILVRLSPLALECLKFHLGARIQNADHLVLRKLQRQHNRRIWEQQSIRPLELSRGHWIFQREFGHDRARWLVGIPDDWSQSGAHVTLWVEGRQLTRCKLILQESTCEIACEVAPDQVNELWTGLDSRAWADLEPRWGASIKETLEQLAGQEMHASLRQSLKRHLASSPRPQFSYFHKTLLLQDWEGQSYTLDQLVSLDPSLQLGVVGPQYQPQDFRSPLIPAGVYLRDTGFELAILGKLHLLNCIVLDSILEDWLEARSLAFQGNTIEPKPEFGVARVIFCVGGVCLAPLSIDSALAFEARICTEDIEVQTILYNRGLGTGRFRPVQNVRVEELLADLQLEFLKVLEQHLQGVLDESWLEWLRQATLRHLCHDILADLPCWPRHPQGSVSLRQLRQARVVHWCSGPVAADICPQLDGEILLPGLSSLVVQELRAAAGDNEWVCQDEAFAREQEHLDFMRQPLWRPSFSVQVLQSQPDLWLMASGSGQVYWLFQGRLIEQEAGCIPYGFRLAVACPSLRVEDRPRQNLDQRCYSFLKEWLAVPRASLWYHWVDWIQRDLPDSVVEGLQSQAWFPTNRGLASWRELLGVPEIWLYPGPTRAMPAELTVVFDRDCSGPTASLFCAHPNAHGVRETEVRLDAYDAQQAHLRLVKQRSERLLGYRYRVSSNLGEIALSGENTKDVWLLNPESELLVSNLPAGLVGFVCCEAEVRAQRSGPPVAELSQQTRDELMEQLAGQLVARVATGPLKTVELDLIAQACQCVDRLDNLRWIECADGSYASLLQLRQEGRGHKRLRYWPRNFVLKVGGPALLPILSTPVMLEVVEKACQVPLELYPPPLLYRPVPLPTLRGFKEALSALAQTNLPLLAGIRQMLSGAPPAAESSEVGQALLEALRRRASQLLSGTPRNVCLHHLEQAQLRPGLERIWQFQGIFLLCSDHPELVPWLGADEPPLTVQTSLLLSLVCAVNAMSLPFTDAMEREFLEQIAQDILESLPRAGSPDGLQTDGVTLVGGQAGLEN